MSGAYGVLFESFSVFQIHRGVLISSWCKISTAWRISPELQTFLRTRKALCALPILALMPASVLPYVSTYIVKRPDFFKGLFCCRDWAATAVQQSHHLCLAFYWWYWIQVSTFFFFFFFFFFFLPPLWMAVKQKLKSTIKVKIIKLWS